MIDNKDMEISSWLGIETRPGWAIFEMCTFLDRFKNNTVPNHIFNTFVCQTSLDNIVVQSYAIDLTNQTIYDMK